jgi:ribonuclease T2
MAATIALIAALATSALAGPRIGSSTDAITPLRSPFDSLISSSCSTSGTTSCHNTTAVSNTCCFEANGLLQQVQVSLGFGTPLPLVSKLCLWTVLGHFTHHWPLEQLGMAYLSKS